MLLTFLNRYLIGVDLCYRVAVQVGKRVLRRRPGSANGLDAAYCVSVWTRHMQVVGNPTTIVELGPGASLGVGVAFVVAGSKRYVALDAVQRAATSIDLDLAAAIAQKMGYSFEPSALEAMTYLAPWKPSDIPDGTVDAVISQAVMEHVTDIEGAYATMARWLVPGGRVSHQIDFRSHAVSPWWNGQLRYPDHLWRRLKPRSDPPNRRLLSEHLDAIEAAGLRIVRLDVDRRRNLLGRWDLAGRFRTSSDNDLSAASAFVIAERPLDSLALADPEVAVEDLDRRLDAAG